MGGVNKHAVCGTIFSGIFFSLRHDSLQQNITKKRSAVKILACVASSLCALYDLVCAKTMSGYGTT